MIKLQTSLEKLTRRTNLNTFESRFSQMGMIKKQIKEESEQAYGLAQNRYNFQYIFGNLRNKDKTLQQVFSNKI